MNIAELFKTLSFGELSNLSLAVEGTGAIVENKQPTVLMFANESLIRLYTRFILKEKQVLIEQIPHITNYHLLERYSESRAPVEGVPYAYIKDLEGEQFVEDVVKIHAVFDNHTGLLPLNDEEQPFSLFTPQATILQIPYPKTGLLTSVAYQAKHPLLTMDNLEAEIEVPDVLEEAMTSYIAYRVYTGMNTDTSAAKAAEYMARYEAICKEAVDRDMVNSSISVTNTRFQKRGWI